uniref:Uncharacterized protein n=1 Tax=Rhizophora mucronata TaxID=61149 RepID=A0A2P2IIX3_RHIMU
MYNRQISVPTDAVVIFCRFDLINKWECSSGVTNLIHP